MMVSGEEVAKNEDRAMKFVVVGVSKGINRTYYPGTYVEGQDNPATCWSAEGVVPNTEVESPQSKACGTCPQNIEGSGQGKSRACRFSKRLAVVLEGDIGGNVYRLSVPAKSFFGKAEGDKMPLQAFGKFLAGHNASITGIVTEARFDTDANVPTLRFRADRALTPSEWAMAKGQSTSHDVQQALEFKFVPSRRVKDEAEEPARPLDAPTVKRAKPPETVAAAPDVAAVLSEWGTDDE